MEQLEGQETADSKYYERGEYLLYGVKSERNGVIIAKVYDKLKLTELVNILNK